MLAKNDLPKIFAYGAQLDAWAARVSRHLGNQVPDYKALLEANRLDELAHARILVGLSTEVPETEYARLIGGAALSPIPSWNATLLNFVERRSEIQFRLAWRLTRNGDLLQIANDESRHVKSGREILKYLGVTETLYARAKQFMDQVDQKCDTRDVSGLERLNQLVYNELTER